MAYKKIQWRQNLKKKIKVTVKKESSMLKSTKENQPQFQSTRGRFGGFEMQMLIVPIYKS